MSYIVGIFGACAAGLLIYYVIILMRGDKQ